MRPQGRWLYRLLMLQEYLAIFQRAMQDHKTSGLWKNREERLQIPDRYESSLIFYEQERLFIHKMC
jgi:hypothetical protein